MKIKKLCSKRSDFIENYIKENNCITDYQLYVNSTNKLESVPSTINNKIDRTFNEKVYYLDEKPKKSRIILNYLKTALVNLGVRNIHLISNYVFKDITFDAIFGFDYVTKEHKLSMIFFMLIDEYGCGEIEDILEELDKKVREDNKTIPYVMVANSCGIEYSDHYSFKVIAVDYKFNNLPKQIGKLINKRL